MEMVKITDADFDEKVKSCKIAVIDFWATWCRPCKAIEPYLLEIAQNFADQGVVVFRLNADEDPAVPAKYSIFSLPTVLFFKDGQLVDKIVGAHPKQKFIGKVEELLEE